MTLIATHKTCRRCGKLLPLSHFVETGKTEDGHTSACVRCLDLINAARIRRTHGVLPAPHLAATPAHAIVTCLTHSRPGCRCEESEA